MDSVVTIPRIISKKMQFSLEIYQNLNNFGSVEFLLQVYEIQNTGEMMKGTVPVPHTAPALIAMMTYYLFRNYRILGGRSGGGETPLSV